MSFKIYFEFAILSKDIIIIIKEIIKLILFFEIYNNANGKDKITAGSENLQKFFKNLSIFDFLDVVIWIKLTEHDMGNKIDRVSE